MSEPARDIFPPAPQSQDPRSIPSHEDKKRNGPTKFNKLFINGLKAIYRLSDELDALLFGGLGRKFLRAPLSLQNSGNRLIFNGLKAKCETQ